MRRFNSTPFSGKFLQPLDADAQNVLSALAAKDLTQFNEQDVREEFLAPLVQLLGYGRGTDYDVRRGEDYQLAPAFIQVGRQRVELDYQFLVYRQGFWLLEAKPAKSTDPKTPPVPKEDDIGQAFFYALHPRIDAPYFAVSNGWHFWLFDRDSDNPTEPILKITQNELPGRFDEIRRFVAADQIVFNIKERLLKRINQVLSADCCPERTGQFVESVFRIADQAQPRVLENFRTARKTEPSSSDWDRTLTSLRLDQLAEFPMEYPRSFGEIKEVSGAVASKLLSQPESTLFYSRLCLEEARAVPMFYYLSSLYTLGTLALNIQRPSPWVPAELRRHPKVDVSHVDLFNWWARLLLTRFHYPPRPELRLLWLLEALVGRITKQLLVYGTSQRKSIIEAVNLQRYMLPEESLSWLIPCPAKQVLTLVEIAQRHTCGIFFRNHFDKSTRRWNSTLAVQHYQQFVDLEQKLVEATADYDSVKKELGSDWSELMCIDHVNKEFDQFGAGICDVLKEFPTLLPKLPLEQQSALGELAELRINYAGKCCNILELPFVERPREECIVGMQKFFIP